MASYTEEIDEGLILLDDPSSGTTLAYGTSLTDGVKLSHKLPVGAYGLTLTSGVILGATPSYVWTAGAAVTETVKLGGHPDPSLIYGVTQVERTKLAAALNVAWAIHMNERVTLAQTQVVTQALALIDKVLLRDKLAPNLIFGVQLIQRILLDEDFGVFYSAVIADHVRLGDTLSSKYISVASLLDGTIMGAVLTNTVTFMATVQDGFVIEDDALVKMIFSGQLNDCVIIKALYVAPDGNFTSWAINTRTNAVTEYRNFVYNSFAQVGRKYLAASNEGLFELNGERDVTANINTKVGGGFVEFNGSRLAGLSGIYIGMRGAGEFFLKMKAGDGREYVYKVRTQPQFMTTKVNVGKGMRSRYFSWTLEGTGADFDFDTIEFVPLTFGRRV